MNYLNLLEEAYELDEMSEARLPLLEEVIREADLARDIETAVEARWLLIDTCLYVGFPKKQLIAFSWLINLYESSEGKVDVFDLLWHYKWIAEHIVRFPEVSLSKINALTEDMQKKFKEYNYSLRPYYKVKTLQAISMGNRAMANEFFPLWQGTKSDFMNDCLACETTEIVAYYHFIGDYQAAIKAAAPILAGRQACAEVPHLTYGHTALSYYHLDKREEAQNSFELGYPMVKKRVSLLTTVSQFITYLLLIDNQEEAVQVYQENQKIASELEGDLSTLHFYLASAGLKHEKQEDCLAQTTTLAQKFDKRNQNTYYQDILAKMQ